MTTTFAPDASYALSTLCRISRLVAGALLPSAPASAPVSSLGGLRLPEDLFVGLSSGASLALAGRPFAHDHRWHFKLACGGLPVLLVDRATTGHFVDVHLMPGIASRMPDYTVHGAPCSIKTASNY